MNHLNTVSIVIPQHGQSAMTAESVTSLIHYHDDACQIIIVDDGSPAPETAALRDIKSCRVSIIRQPRRSGVTAAWNLGAKAATGKHLLFLNNDTITHGPWCNELIEVLSKTGVRLCGINWREVSSWERNPIASEMLLQGWCLGMTRETFDLLQGFDERFRLYFSDTDFQLRCLTRWPFCLAALESAPLEHLGQMSTRRWSGRRSEWIADQQRFSAKWNKD